MSVDWQISSAEVFEFIRPAFWTLSTLLSAWVLASARRHGLNPYAVAAWTLGTLFFPLIFLPLYLIIRARRRKPGREASTQTDEPLSTANALTASPLWRRALLPPLLYALVVLSLVGLVMYRDYRSVDAHLSRANIAKLRGPHEKVIKEYREALRLDDNPHTRKLLGIELAQAGRHEETIAELRKAEEGGEPDNFIPLYIARALDALGQPAQARLEYSRFLKSPLCEEPLPDALCVEARTKLAAAAAPPPLNSTPK